MNDTNDLVRFLTAQKDVFSEARAEIVAGEKRTHWMWFIYPQLRGLGRSARAYRYGIDGLDEATRYLAHPTLGARLVDMFTILLEHHPQADPHDIFGSVDAAKLRSSATLFAQVDGAPEVFERILQTYFAAPCPRTLAGL